MEHPCTTAVTGIYVLPGADDYSAQALCRVSQRAHSPYFVVRRMSKKRGGKISCMSGGTPRTLLSSMEPSQAVMGLAVGSQLVIGLAGHQ